MFITKIPAFFLSSVRTFKDKLASVIMSTTIQMLQSEVNTFAGKIDIDIVWVIIFSFILVWIILIHHFMICSIRDKPPGSKTLFDAAIKDTLIVIIFSGSVFCLIDILSRFESVRNLCIKYPGFLTFACVMYFLAFISVAIHNASMCIIKIACIINLTFMEETLGETFVRALTASFTLVVSILTCLLLVFLDEMNFGAAIILFTHQVIPTSNYNSSVLPIIRT